MISIGTCSWTEKTLIRSGEFYPKDIRTAEGRLRYRHAKTTYVMFNNCHGGFAIKNALRLRELMKGEKDTLEMPKEGDIQL
ncbi:MAG: hypothetical protein ACPL1G_02955 [Thermodesulfovibrionales bacterium]